MVYPRRLAYRYTGPKPHAVVQAGAQDYRYDGNGNMTLRDGKRMVWNPENQPTWIEGHRNTWTHSLYDASGQRAFESVSDKGPNSKGFAISPAKKTYYFGPLLEYSPSKGLTKYYFAGSRLVASNGEGGKHFYHQDHLDSTRLVTDKNGKAVRRYDYAPFGGTMQQTESSSFTTDIQFGGHRTDGQTDLTYMGARYYDPELARFTSADTIVPERLDPQALNRFSYVYNNPLSYTDPTGHSPQWFGGILDYADFPQQVPVKNLEFPDMTNWTDEQAEGYMYWFCLVVDKQCSTTDVTAPLLDPNYKGPTISQYRFTKPNDGIFPGPKTNEIFQQTVGEGLLNTGFGRLLSVGKVFSGAKSSISSVEGLAARGETGAIVRSADDLIAPTSELVSGSEAALVGTSRSQMRREAQRLISDTPDHPLKRLLDESGKFKPTRGLTHAELMDRPDLVQMGHTASNKLGGGERLMIQGAWENQFANLTVEHPSVGAAVLETPAVDIGGIAVDLRTAKFWEAIGWLPEGTVKNAPIVR